MKRVLCVLTAVTLVTVSAAAQVSFDGLQLNSAGELLFTAESTVPGLGDHDTLLYADIPGAEMRQLTVFPERLVILESVGEIQIQNRFGVFRTPLPAAPMPDTAGDTPDGDTADGDTAGGATTADGDAENAVADTRPQPGFVPVTGFPAFIRGEDIQTGKTVAVGASPDGRYLSYLVPTSPGYGDLRLTDTRTGNQTTVTRNVELTLDAAPLRWSPDSSFFIYGKGNELFYFSLDQYRRGRTLNEDLRRIGPGTVASIQWRGDNTLFYVRGSLVYRVLGMEFFTRSLYQDLLGIGSIVGKLPDSFDPNFDRFWIAPDGSKILLSEDGRSVRVLFLQTDDYATTGDTLSLPFLYLPRNTRVQTVLWSDDDVLTVLTGSILHGEQTTDLYRIDLRNEEERSRFTATEDENVLGVSMSPDGTRAAVWTADGVSVRRYGDWQEMASVTHPGLIHTIWQGSTRLVLAGRHTIERIDLREFDDTGAGRELLALSSVDAYGFAPDGGAIRAAVGQQRYELTDEGWTALDAEELQVAEPGVSSEDYRVYLENLSRGSYRNMVMVRNVESFGTVPLFPRPRRQYEPFPERDQPVDLTNFSHGSRIRLRQVSLVFNAIDSVAGLTEILNTLAEYDLQATFFLNGDFIRRHPGAVREIANSGHEVGSLFYTYFDMSSGRFQVNADFVKQGLARNEDEYFEVTGEELSLLWHAPYYFSSPTIISASREMNYAYIGRDVDSMDWVPLRDENGLSRLYKPTAEIIEDVIENKQPGSIIAMTVGKPGDDRPDGGREDYLFQRLDVLINGLIERGYGIVPVSTLMDNAR